MTDADALLDAVFADPDADTPRLVYADWLDENRQPNYAEFVRLQVEAARHPFWSPEANRLWEEIGRVWTSLAEDWRDLLFNFPHFDATHFRRGLLARPVGRSGAEELLEFTYRSAYWHPAGVFDRLECFLNDFEHECGPDAADDLWELGRFDRLRELTVIGGRVPPDLFDRPLPRLRVLDLSEIRIGRRFAEGLVRAAGLTGLRRLVVGREADFTRDVSQLLWRRFDGVIQFGRD